MQKSPIRIGSIDLQDFEIPPSVSFGGGYSLQVHKLASGRRILEKLGPDESEIRFQGIFSGPHAETRLRQLNNLRLSGQIVWLTWQSFRYQVIIKSFAAQYRNQWWIPYNLICMVVSQPGVDETSITSLSASISADFSAAIAALSGSSIGLTTLKTALSAPNAYITGTSDQMNATAAVKTSLLSIDNQISQSSSALDSDNEPTTPSLYANSYLAQVAVAGTLATAVIGRAYVSRIGCNLQ